MTSPTSRPTLRLGATLLALGLGTGAAAQSEQEPAAEPVIEPAAEPAAPAAPAAAFRDDFTAFDPDRWYVSDGWSNGDWQACTWSRSMVAVEDGVLRLSLAATEAGAATGEDASAYLCGEVQTNEVYGHGTFEARIRTDQASGVNAAFFTYIGPVHDKPHDEIDVEILTRDTRSFDVNTYRDGVPNHGTKVPVPAGTDADFHTYSFIWEPERLRWFLDGALVHEATGPDLPVNAQKMFLSHWNSRTFVDWMGEFRDPGRPLDMWIDWIAYTPPGAACPFEGSVLCGEGVGG